METFSSTLLSICMGVGLAAACGFRVFVPLFLLSLAAHSGHVTLAPSFVWIGSTPALVAFGVATVVEVAGYYVPWLDHLLDTLATPVAVIAGTLVTAAVLTDQTPFFRWTLALIAGGGVAGLVQGGTVAARVVSTTGTGGLGNPIVASAEVGFSGLLAFLSLAWPLLSVVLGLGLAVGLGYWIWKRKVLARAAARETASAPSGP